MIQRIETVVLKRLPILLFVLAVSFATAGALTQHPDSDDENLDPGPRAGTVDAGGPLANISPQEQAFFENGLSQFIEVEDVINTSPGNGGLGPTFNSNSCSSCHSQPAVGGTSPSINAFPFVGQNPQFTVGQSMGGANTIPFFVLPNGPVREARFKSDNAVHDLFTIAGRSDAGGCSMAQPDFNQAAAQGNLSFRIPLQLFGDGLVENIGEDTLMANVATSANPQLGIQGTFNRSGNDGTITRFGWKAQNKSLRMFAGEAYNVEMGVTNELFTNERGQPPNPIPANCLINSTPEDRTIFESTTPGGVPSDIDLFRDFMTFLAPPTPAAPTPATVSGQETFAAIGCANCHTPTLITDLSDTAPALSQVPANLFSDLALHHMGVRLADGITQGNAGPDQFRTAPLWGLGQRVFFLHDGRTSNLVQAIREHKSQGSEASRVIDNFENLARGNKQNLILFLRSL